MESVAGSAAQDARPKLPTRQSAPSGACSNTYYKGMGAQLDVADRSERIARRELYRHCARIGELVIDVAERVVYAVVKQN